MMSDRQRGRLAAKIVSAGVTLVLGLAAMTFAGELLSAKSDLAVFFGALIFVLFFAAFAVTIWSVVRDTPDKVREEFIEAEEARRVRETAARRRQEERLRRERAEQAERESRERAEKWAEETIRTEAEEELLRQELDRMRRDG